MRTLLLILALAPFSATAQKHDYIWVAGRNNNPGNTKFGGSIIDFNQHPPSVQYHYRPTNMFTSNASLCDTSGNLLFYSNGCVIAGADDGILTNGDGLNPGYMHDLRCDSWNDGYGAGYPSMVALQQPETDSVYYLFHERSEYVSSPKEDVYNNQLLYSRMRHNKAKGLIEVSDKNIELMGDSLAAGELSAVKHGNGKDWWIILPRRNSNQFYVFLFTKDGIVDTFMQTIGAMPPKEEEGSGQTTFSHDGATMARYYSYHDVMMYDFDRSTGHFSNYRTVHIEFGNTLAFDGGCAFSPNGRFLYIMALLKVYQFDLGASDISGSQTTVGEWDGFKDPIATVFAWAQLGPDCKIYSQCGDMRYYHIIHNPDEKGLACNFQQRGLVLPTPSGASMPYFPNYRLGPIGNPGLPCSQVVSTQLEPLPQVSGVQVYPNPAREHLTIEYRFADKMERCLLLHNALGQLVRRLSLPDGAGKVQISTDNLPAGFIGTLFHPGCRDLQPPAKLFSTTKF